jgi:hypothetical protein
MAREPRRDYEVERAVSGDLVGDRHVAALRVANRTSHGAIVAGLRDDQSN